MKKPLTPRLLLILFVLTMILSGLLAPLAFAAETTAPAAEDADITSVEVTPFQTLNYKLIYIEGTLDMEGMWVGLLSGELAEDARLPALIEVAVPAGTHTGWFGQLPGLEFPGEAIQFDEPYDMRTEDGMDIYSAVMTSFHMMQLEFRFDGEPAVRDGNHMTMNLSYTPVQDVEELHLTAAFPAGFASTEADLRFLGAGPQDEQTYSRIFENVNAGETIETSIDAFYAGAGAAEATTDITTLIIVFAVAAVIIGGVSFFFVRGQKKSD